jgi:hypothetical protein
MDKMNFIEKLTNLVFGKIYEFEHPFWGVLKDAGNSFEGKKKIESVQLNITFHLPKVSTAQQQKQIEFFRTFDENYSAFRQLFIAAMRREIEYMKLDNVVGDFDQDYELDFMDLPTCAERPFEWEISYYESKDFHHWFTFFVRGNEVVDVMMDG